MPVLSPDILQSLSPPKDAEPDSDYGSHVRIALPSTDDDSSSSLLSSGRSILSSSPPPPSLRPSSSSSSKLAVLPRQDSDNNDGFVAVPSALGSLHNSQQPGIVVGITLGSVAGFLLLLFLLYSCLGFGPVVAVQGVESHASRSVISLRSRRTDRHHSRRRTSGRGGGGGARVTETYEVRAREHEGGPVRSAAEATPIIRTPSRAPSRAPPPPRVVREEEDDEESEDEIVVMEEHSPPRRRGDSRRRSGGGRYSGDDRDRRRESGYRDVDPERFAGGDAPYREVRRGSSRYSRDR